jgi:hypothetical protein
MMPRHGSKHHMCGLAIPGRVGNGEVRGGCAWGGGEGHYRSRGLGEPLHRQE